MELNKRIKELRRGTGKTQKEVADSLGIALSSYQYYERGERNIPSDTLIAIVNTYSVNSQWLLTGSGWAFTPSSTEIAFDWMKMQIQNHAKKIVAITYHDEIGGYANGFLIVRDNGPLSMKGSETRSGYAGTGPRIYARILNLIFEVGVPFGHLELDKEESALLEKKDMNEFVSRADYSLSAKHYAMKDLDFDEVGKASKAGLILEEFVSIPQIRNEVKEDGTFVSEETSEMKLSFRRQWIQQKGNPESMSLMRVLGDSMEPSLCPGDTVLIDHSCNSVDPEGGLYAIVIENTLMIKRLQVVYPGKRVRVISDNERYITTEMDQAQLTISGKVIWFSRTLVRT